MEANTHKFRSYDQIRALHALEAARAETIRGRDDGKGALRPVPEAQRERRREQRADNENGSRQQDIPGIPLCIHQHRFRRCHGMSRQQHGTW